jgi:negative regulator of sigma E activity
MNAVSRLDVATILLLAIANPGHAAASADPLSRAVQARQQVAYRGEQIVATWHGGRSQVTMVQVEHDPPDWSRVEYHPVGSTQRLAVVRQGNVQMQYDLATLQGTRTPRLNEDDSFFTTHLQWLKENYRTTLSASEVMGRKTDRAELRPVAADRPTRRIEVDRETGVILRSERIAPDGRLGELTAFVSFHVMNIGWHTGASPPPGLRLAYQPRVHSVTAAQASRLLGGDPIEIVPPDGFHRVAYYAMPGGKPEVQTVYTDGLSVLVVSQRHGTIAMPPVGSKVVHTPAGPLWIHNMGLRTLVHWSHANRVLTMIGDVSEEALLRSAQQTGVASAPLLYHRLLVWLRQLLPSL